MKTIVSYSKRPYVYAFLLTVGMVMLYSIVRTSGTVRFLIGSFSLYLLLLFELYSTKYYVFEIDKQLTFEKKDIKHRRAHWVHHLVLPTILFLSFVLFILVNSQLNMLLFLSLLSFALFSFTFINIKAYYERKYKIEKQTANIYDIISISSVYMLIYSLLVLGNFFGYNFIIAGLFNTLILLAMGFLTISRYDLLNKKGYILLGALVLIYINLFLILLGYELSVLVYAVIATFGFYYFTVVVDHMDEDSLTLRVILEYLAVFLVIFVIIVLGNI